MAFRFCLQGSIPARMTSTAGKAGDAVHPASCRGKRLCCSVTRASSMQHYSAYPHLAVCSGVKLFGICW